MKTISVPRLPDEVYEKYGLDIPEGDTSTYIVPSKQERIQYIKETHSETYDPIEKRMVSGGLSLKWERK